MGWKQRPATAMSPMTTAGAPCLALAPYSLFCSSTYTALSLACHGLTLACNTIVSIGNRPTFGQEASLQIRSATPKNDFREQGKEEKPKNMVDEEGPVAVDSSDAGSTKGDAEDGEAPVTTFTNMSADELSAEELNEYKEIFNLVDRDGGGSISNSELGELMVRASLGSQTHCRGS